MAEQTGNEVNQNSEKSVTEDYLTSLVDFSQSNLKTTQIQLETLNKMHTKTNNVYEKSLEKINKIKDEITDASQIYDQIKAYFAQIDDIGKMIENMDHSLDSLTLIVDRLESKFQDL
mmetsp:Transcript_34449/g.40288  ORF Transcript_34449/g.40288 Transcript_34449/m.40288 type:complete len:117 (+) Transcript_34449:45-395(+)